MWFVLEVLQHPEVLARVREEIATCIKHDSTNKIVDVDVTRLCSNPLLQSIYAEVLRMQVGIALPLTASVPECSIEGWSFKQGETILASTWHAGRDHRVWNTGTVDDPHPVDEFWAERFLVKPDDPVHIGPVKRVVDKDLTEETTPSSSTGDFPQQAPPGNDHQHHNGKGKDKDEETFSLSGTAGSWIPFGGGVKLCPGRHFAKQEMIVASAMFLDAFDIELITGKKRIVPDGRFFPFGNMPPKGKIRARVRRRVSSTVYKGVT
jgi:cytochrome P450